VLAQLKLYRLKKKQVLLHQEEETKLELGIVDAQYEIQRTDLQLKMFKDEKPAAADLQDVFEDLKPFSEQVNVPQH